MTDILLIRVLVFMLAMGFVGPSYAGATFLDSPLAPSAGVGAGRFDGSTLFLDVMDDTEASYGQATGLIASTITPGLIAGTGSASTLLAGEGAAASMLVWFTLDKPEPFTFMASASGGTDYFNSAYAELVVYNKDTTEVTPITATSGFLDPRHLGSSEVFLVTARAIATKPLGAPYYPIESNFSFNLTIGTAPIPEPEIYAMMLAGLGVVGAAARRIRQSEATSR